MDAFSAWSQRAGPTTGSGRRPRADEELLLDPRVDIGSAVNR